MHVVITGGSGFVGRYLQSMLVSAGHEVTILSRNPNRVPASDRVRAVRWLADGSAPEEKLGKVDAIVNLAGESINGLRWTNAKKQRIIQSRMQATGEVIRIISSLESKPKVLVNASAVGFYGMSDSKTFIETSESHADDFLAKVVKKWEGKAAEAREYNVRTVFARLGVVLGKKEGALPLMALPYKLGVGGTLGSGTQWMSWVHAEDAVRMIMLALTNEEISGPFNVVSPNPLQMEEFGKTLASVLGRLHWFPVPALLLKMALGEMSDMLLGGQRVLPEAARLHHYSFQYPTVREALEEIYEKRLVK